MFEFLEIFANWLIFEIFSIEKGSRLGDVVSYFIDDTLKIFLLLFLITFLMSLIRFYIPITKIRDFLTKRRFFGMDYFLATMFGAITPFCTCSSIPLFIGFIQAQIPMGVTFAFLITSPLINEVAVSLFIGIFGWKVTLIYVISGILIGMIGGFILGKLKMEKYIEDFVWKIKPQKQNQEKIDQSFNKIFKLISKDAFGIIKKVSLYILFGIGLGAVIHGYVPEGFFEIYLQKAGIFGVPLAVLLAVPLYSNAAGVIPIIQSLIVKGVPLGTALAFMMAIVGLSLPEALILKKIMKWQLLGTFFGIVTVGIIIIGYLFNWVF